MRIKNLIRGIVLLPLLAASFCFGQQSVRIGPGDVLNIHVYDTPDLEQTVRVTDSGDVELVLIGIVHVGSLTPTEAAHKIEDSLIAKNVMKYPSVTVNVASYETENVSVVGEVKSPGPVPTTTPRSALDIISLSGGLTDLADRQNIMIRHKAQPGEKAEVAVFKFSNDPQQAIVNDVLVQPGDTVIVPRVGVVYVLGDVARPGGFPIDTPDSQMTILQAVALAGATNHSASPGKARLIRKNADGSYQDIPVQVSNMQKGKAKDIPMMPNDILYIPFSYWKNTLALGAPAILSGAAAAEIYTH